MYIIISPIDKGLIAGQAGKGELYGHDRIRKARHAVEQLSMLYRIKADSKEENKTLEYEITVTEQRLIAMGYNDFSKLEFKKAD